MDLSSYVAGLRDDLTTAASAGDEQARRSAAVLAAALEPAARLMVMNALSDMAAEVTAALEDRVVEVRLDGRDVQVRVTGADGAAASEEPPEPEEPVTPSDATGDISRITLRLLDELKGRAEQAAASQGVSLNSWVSQAVQGALAGNRYGRPGWAWDAPGSAGERGRRGNRFQGWVQG